MIAEYLKAVYNLFSDQKNYRIKRDLETYRYLKLDSNKRRKTSGSIDFSKIEYKDNLDLNEPPEEDKNEDFEPIVKDDDKQSLIPKSATRSSKKPIVDDENTQMNQSMEDDLNSSSQMEQDLSPEDIQMLEIENKQIYNEFQGLSEEVQQIEKQVYDIAKLQDLFSEKVLNLFLNR